MIDVGDEQLDLAGHDLHRMHAGLHPRKAASTMLETIFRDAKDDTHGMTSSERTRQRHTARDHAHHPNLTIKKEINNNGLQEADPLSSFVRIDQRRRDWMSEEGAQHTQKVSKIADISREQPDVDEREKEEAAIFIEKQKAYEAGFKRVEAERAANEKVRNAVRKSFLEEGFLEGLKAHTIVVDGIEVGGTVLVKWGSLWMQANVLKVEVDQILVCYHGHERESERWIERRNGRIRPQTKFCDLHKTDDRRGAFPKMGDGVLVRVVDTAMSKIYKGFETGLLGTCVKCMPSKDASVIEVNSNRLCAPFKAMFANSHLSLRYPLQFQEERANYIHTGEYVAKPVEVKEESRPGEEGDADGEKQSPEWY
jgi:hypothetical protein